MRRSPFSGLGSMVLLVAACSIVFESGLAIAQSPGSAAAGGNKASPPEEGSVITKDNVKIVFTYLSGSQGKDSVPVILLHMFKGNRHEMEGLGLYLQQLGFAVIMPDLRGHGDSTTAAVITRPLDAATMPVQQFGNMVTQDLEALKKFIIEKNNAGLLNVDKLAIVGAEMGASVAVLWAAQDWSWPPLAMYKQGQDVKALVLLSPQMSFKPTLTLSKALNFDPVKKEISFFLIAGSEDGTSARDARQIAEGLERARRAERADKPLEKSVFLLVEDLKTKLVGSKLLGEQSLGIEEYIADYLQRQVADQPFPWKERKTP